MEDRDDRCCCDISCKTRLYAGFALALTFTMAQMIGPCMLFAEKIDVSPDLLFKILYSAGTVGAMLSSCCFACVKKQWRKIRDMPVHLVAFLTIIVCIVMVPISVYVIPAGPDVTRGLAVGFGALQGGAFALFCLSINGFVWNRVRCALKT
jgi:hypothetical protein